MVTKDGSERGTEETKSRTEEEDENDRRRERTKEDETCFFFFFHVIFKRSTSHRNRRGWVTEWLFYYVADWPQPSNIWTCMCGGFLQAPLLIIFVLLVTFSFSHSFFFFFRLCSNRINTLYLDTPLFVCFHTKPVCVSQRIKITFAASPKCHSDCFDLILLLILASSLGLWLVLWHVLVWSLWFLWLVVFLCSCSAIDLKETGHVEHITSCLLQDCL